MLFLKFPPDLDPALAAFAGFHALLALRATCRAALVRCDPGRARLWGAAAPPLAHGFAQLRRACIDGSLPVIVRLTNLFTLDRNYNDPAAYYPGGIAAVRLACEYGHLAAAIWLVTKFRLVSSVYPVRAEKSWHIVCARGHLPVAVWMVDYFKIDAKRVRGWDYGAVRWACERGPLPVAVWLADRFAITANDIRNATTYNTYVAIWIIVRFNLSASDIGAATSPKMRWACLRAKRGWHRRRGCAIQ